MMEALARKEVHGYVIELAPRAEPNDSTEFKVFWEDEITNTKPEIVIEGSLIWDGCIHWKTGAEPNWAHECGGFARLARLLLELHRIQKERYPMADMFDPEAE